MKQVLAQWYVYVPICRSLVSHRSLEESYVP